jgi:hypothetical protein
MSPSRRLTRGDVACVLLGLVLGVLMAVCTRPVYADEDDRFAPSARAARYEATRALVEDRAAAHGVNAEVLWAVVLCEVSDLDPAARGDGGHSHGLAQLNDRPENNDMLGHFHSRGYTTAYDRWQALDYMARAFGGEFAGSAWGDIGPWRWSCWRRLRGWR